MEFCDTVTIVMTRSGKNLPELCDNLSQCHNVTKCHNAPSKGEIPCILKIHMYHYIFTGFGVSFQVIVYVQYVNYKVQ